METGVKLEVSANASARKLYWPEVDGLRTIAVLSVFVFHLSRNALPGGFVGVDVFFVISGFLIGLQLIEDIAGNRFSMARFYQRRISRIFPALILVILVTLAAASFVYSAQDLAYLGTSSAAAAASIINMKLIWQGSYFSISPDAQPLMHYWSLAVEEQFYLVFPVFLFLVSRSKRHVLAITLGVAALSFAACVFLTPGHQSMAFYSLPTRAWELLAGSSLALWRSGGGRLAGPVAQACGWAGLALVVGSIALLEESLGFPGWVAAFPVIGTVLLLAPVGDGRNAIVGTLAHPLMVAIGKRSYSMYLWHWPVFSLIDYRFYASGEAERIGLKIALTLILTMLSYSLVERPVRTFLNAQTRRVPMFVVTAGLVALIAGGGTCLRYALYFDVPAGSIARGGISVHGGDKAVVILSGDSQAAMFGAEIGTIAKARDFNLYAVSTAGRNQLPGEEGTSWPAVAALVAGKKPDLVILIDAWSIKLKGNPAKLEAALADLAGHARQVLLVAEIPATPGEITRNALGAHPGQTFAEPAGMRAEREASLRMLRSLEGANVRVVDVSSLFVAGNGGLKLVGPDSRLTYKDSHHLTDTGTAIARPLLDRAIQEALASARPPQ